MRVKDILTHFIVQNHPNVINLDDITIPWLRISTDGEHTYHFLVILVVFSLGNELRTEPTWKTENRNKAFGTENFVTRRAVILHSELYISEIRITLMEYCTEKHRRNNEIYALLYSK